MTVQGPVKEQQPDGMSHRGGSCNVVTSELTFAASGLCLLEKNNKKSRGNHRRRRKISVGYTRIQVIVVWCPSPPPRGGGDRRLVSAPPPPPGGGGKPPSLGGGGGAWGGEGIRRGVCTGVVPWTVSAALGAAASNREPKKVHGGHGALQTHGSCTEVAQLHCRSRSSPRTTAREGGQQGSFQ